MKERRERNFRILEFREINLISLGMCMAAMMS